jgi:hypothetical protein
VWLDTHGRVVRVDFGFDHKSQGLVITASTEFSGFGKPFDLVRPHQIEQGRGDLSGSCPRMSSCGSDAIVRTAYRDSRLVVASDSEGR